jgi:5-methylcytosine-specific restriction protein A
MAGVYLSLNQGVTSVRKLYGRKARMVLRSRADEFRLALGSAAPASGVTAIDLAVSRSDRGSYYEDGNIVAICYERDDLPSEDKLVGDFLTMTDLYRALVDKYAAGVPIGEDDDNDDDANPPTNAAIEDASKRKLHARIERNRTLSRRAKKVHGYRCQACDIQLEDVYGGVAKSWCRRPATTCPSRRAR